MQIPEAICTAAGMHISKTLIASHMTVFSHIFGKLNIEVSILNYV
jgi:hypothetical protein